MSDGLKYNKKMSDEEFSKLITLPLDEKIKLSEAIIVEFMENIDCSDDKKVYISCSFGKDSVVLVDLVRKLYPKIPIIFSDTGLEYKGIYKVKEKYENVITVNPLRTMEEHIEKEGYILPIGKAKSKSLRRARRWIKEEKWDNGTFKLLSGKGEYGKGSLFNHSSALPYIIAPFPISERCDDFLKKKPLDKYIKEHNFKYSFNGITYDESRMRRATLLRDGFNKMSSKTSLKSRPMGHWNTNDVLKYICDNDLEISDSYGEIIKNKDGYDVTLFKRSGCYCCPCGCHMEKYPNRYQILYYYDYDAWTYTMYDLGFKKILDYFDVPYYPNDVVDDVTLDKYVG